MKKMIKRVSSLFLSAMLLFAAGTSVWAAQADVVYQGGAEKFVFLPEDDLFPTFKNVMPGDVLSQEITVKNSFDGCDYVDLYLRAEAHDETANPPGPEAQGAGETAATMADFLSQFSLTVTMGDQVIYEASPDQTDGLTENVFLGAFRQGETAGLVATLHVPIELGNEYANCTGEVDWIFTAEEKNDPLPTVTPEPAATNAPLPSSAPTPSATPAGSPKTGDTTNTMLWLTLLIISALGVTGSSMLRRRR